MKCSKAPTTTADDNLSKSYLVYSRSLAAQKWRQQESDSLLGAATRRKCSVSGHNRQEPSYGTYTDSEISDVIGNIPSGC